MGWQDPAVIRETGCCVWKSGAKPFLEFKRNGDFLNGRMAIAWTGAEHDTPAVVDLARDYPAIARSAERARAGVLAGDVKQLAEGVSMYYEAQVAEGMQPLPDAPTALARKYCGGGHGGYALYLFMEPAERDAWVAAETDTRRPVEPWCSHGCGPV